MAARLLSALALVSALSGVPLAFAASDTLVIAKAEEPRDMDPAIEVSNNGYTAIYPSYERLLQYKVENGVGTSIVEPSLAQSWTSDAAGLVWTFKLAPGHKFEDGSPVDAEAVKFSFERLLKIKGGPADTFGEISKIEALDPLTVRFTLADTFAPFLSTFTLNGASIVSPKVMEHEKDGDLGKGWLNEHTLGSGPYKVARWDKGQSIQMELNPSWTGPKPAITKIMMRFIKDASARRLQLENGDVDIVESVPVDQAQAVKSNPAIVVQNNPSMFVTYIYLNNKVPALKDVRVRQAISYAVDYDGIINGILQGQGTRMHGPIPEGMWGRDLDAKVYDHDLDKAKALLREAGVGKLKLGYLYAQQDPNWEPIGLTIQANLAEIGIQVEMQNYAYATMRDKLGKGDFDMAAGNWTPDFADPYMWMNSWFDSNYQGLPGDRAFYVNPKVDELVRKAATLTDRDERTKLYNEAEKITDEEAPYVYLFQKNDLVLMRHEVKGFVYNPMLLQVYNFETMSKS